MLERRYVVETLLADRGDALVVTGLGSPTYDVAAVSPSDRNFYLWGAMGGAVMMGLGLALSQPKTPVVVVTGDGEALMGMGALATVAAKAPKNLTLLVLDNEQYGETGSQRSHAGLGADLCAVAAACGIPQCVTLHTEAALQALQPVFLAGDATRFVLAKIAPSSPPRVMPTRDGVENKLRFKAAIGT